MEFFKMNKLKKALKPPDKEPLVVVEQAEEEIHNKRKEKEKEKENGAAAAAAEEEDDDDDEDFIMNEVKRRLKELRRNSFMVLIPEEETETCPPEEEEEEMEMETSSSSNDQWRDVEEEGRRLWSCFGAFYDNYCDRMLFFDRHLLRHIQQQSCSCCCSSDNNNPPSPASNNKFFTSPFRCLSLRKTPPLPPPPSPQAAAAAADKKDPDHLLDLETAYVSHLCLAWEALHCQYTQLLASDTTSKCCYNHSAQQFQQFQVLLHRFLENEPFHPSLTLRPHLYAHSRTTFPKLLQVPNLSGEEMTAAEEEESDMLVRAPDLLRVIETSILTFQMFIKMDKKKKNKNKSQQRNLFGSQGQNQMATPLQQVQSSLDKRKVRLKELWKKRKGGKKKEWPATQEEVELLLGLIDVKVVGRVLRMANITKDHLFWSEEKMKKLHVSTTKLQRDPSPILFPC